MAGDVEALAPIATVLRGALALVIRADGALVVELLQAPVLRDPLRGLAIACKFHLSAKNISPSYET